MIRFLLCDDDKKFLEHLSKMLDSIFITHDLDAEVDFIATNDVELLSYIKEHSIDVFMLDSNLNGIDLAKIIRKKNKNCYIIFITCHVEYSEQAYKCKTFDFLHKPLSKFDLEETILRLFDDITGYTSHKKYININGKKIFIDTNEITYIRRDGMKIILHTPSENIELYSSFNKLQDKLPDNFVRCHKSFIVNINNITKLELSSNAIYFKDNVKCHIGPKYKKNFMKEVKLYD